MTVAIPTLTAGPVLAECLAALERQTIGDFDVIIVDNSGKYLVRKTLAADSPHRVLEPASNLGFGAAINAAYAESRAPFLAVLNDDAVAWPGWIEALAAALESHPEVGLCASQVRLAGRDALDSAGMAIASDGSSKQRGHGEAPERFNKQEEVLLPSGSAAMFRRSMLEETGLFDEDFFLYCEDTDLGLRARWAGWKCLYVPGAVVDHRYSETAGRASPLKAYYVERNRLFVVAKNFPAPLLFRVPFASLVRYFWHAVAAWRGHGAAGQFRREHTGIPGLAWIALRAHCAVLANAGRLWRKRRQIRARARLSARDFRGLLAAHSIALKEVAAL